MLKNDLVPKIKQLCLTKGVASTELWWQEDSAPALKVSAVIEYLRTEFDDRIIAVNGPHEWHPYTPDLTLLVVASPKQLDAGLRSTDDLAIVSCLACESIELNELRRSIFHFLPRHHSDVFVKTTANISKANFKHTRQESSMVAT